jgi:hypothetical protein
MSYLDTLPHALNTDDSYTNTSNSSTTASSTQRNTKEKIHYNTEQTPPDSPGYTRHQIDQQTLEYSDSDSEIPMKIILPPSATI